MIWGYGTLCTKKHLFGMDIVGERVFSLSLSGYVELWGPQRKKVGKKGCNFSGSSRETLQQFGVQ